MKTPIQPGTSEIPELDLVFEWKPPVGRRRVTEATIGSITLHLLAVAGLLWLPATSGLSVDQAEMAALFSRATPLVAPPPRLTQRAVNRGPVSEEANLEGLLPRPPLQSPPPPVEARREVLAPEPPVLDPPEVEPPQVAMAQPPPQLELPTLSVPAPPPPAEIRVGEKPKLAFEAVGSMTFSQQTSSGVAASSGSLSNAPRIERPRSSVQEAIREVARRGAGGGIVVGDIEAGGFAATAEARGLPLSPSRTGSSLELLSDPKGVEFRPYLIQILGAVRRNWFAVMPESAKFGRPGKVVIQFSIDRSGRVPKLVIASPSGTKALDRAAVAGVSASNPFPPLPAAYLGDQIRLQFNFLYNIKR